MFNGRRDIRRTSNTGASTAPLPPCDRTAPGTETRTKEDRSAKKVAVEADDLLESRLSSLFPALRRVTFRPYASCLPAVVLVLALTQSPCKTHYSSQHCA